MYSLIHNISQFQEEEDDVFDDPIDEDTVPEHMTIPQHSKSVSICVQYTALFYWSSCFSLNKYLEIEIYVCLSLPFCSHTDLIGYSGDMESGISISYEGQGAWLITNII